MKKILLGLAALVCFSACNGDDDNASSDGSLTINGETDALRRGYIVPPMNDNPDADPRRFLIILTDGGIHTQGEEAWLSANTQHLISLNLNTDIAHAGSVQSTTYPIWTPTNGLDQDGAFSEVFVDADMVIDEDGDIDSSTEYSSDVMETGEVTIEKNGSVYHITLSMQNGDDTVTASFHGTLSQINLY